MAEEDGSRSGQKGQTSPTLKRLDFKKQRLEDAYLSPDNFFEINVCDPEIHGLARNRYTNYEIRMKVLSPDKGADLGSSVGSMELL